MEMEMFDENAPETWVLVSTIKWNQLWIVPERCYEFKGTSASVCTTDPEAWLLMTHQFGHTDRIENQSDRSDCEFVYRSGSLDAVFCAFYTVFVDFVNIEGDADRMSCESPEDWQIVQCLEDRVGETWKLLCLPNTYSDYMYNYLMRLPTPHTPMKIYKKWPRSQEPPSSDSE